MIPSEYFEVTEILWYVNHMLEKSGTTVRVDALEEESTFDMRFSATTSQGKKTAAIIEYQWDRSEGVLQVARLWKMHNPALPYNYARPGKPEKNLMLLKGWGFNAPVLTPAREKVVGKIERRGFHNDLDGTVRARALQIVAENKDYDEVATIAIKEYAKPKRDVILFEPVREPGPSL